MPLFFGGGGESRIKKMGEVISYNRCRNTEKAIFEAGNRDSLKSENKEKGEVGRGIEMKNLEMKNLALIIWRRKGSLSIDYLGQVLDYIFFYI